VPGSADLAGPAEEGDLPGVPDFVWGEEPAEQPDSAAGAAAAEADEFAVPSAFGDAQSAESRWTWADSGSEAADDVPGDRWDSGTSGFAVSDEGAAAAEPVPAASTEAGAEPLTAAALPIGEWEQSAATVEVEEPATTVEEPVSPAVELPVASSALNEVADRLDRIARSLRSGNPADALDQGDPLQLLITGYALGYSEARKGGGKQV
jgi:hypothetical protein